MSTFDADVWRDRAWERFRRAQASLPPRDKEARRAVEDAWYRDVSAVGDLARVVGWCGERGLEVEFVKRPGGTFHSGERKMLISSRMAPLRQVIILLHECGHSLIGHQTASGRYNMGYPQTDPEVTKTFHYRATCLDEEMEAWHRGWKLARRLRLAVTREKYDEVRLECIRSYIKWALRPGPPPKET